MRSGLGVILEEDPVVGIISACAERTSIQSPWSWFLWDHLRVCGADCDRLMLIGLIWGSSPRVRSGPVEVGVVGDRHGIISACAERTVVFYCGLSRSGDMEYLIRALRGVGKRRGYQYLE